MSYIIPFVLYTVMSVTKMSSSSSIRKMNDNDDITANQRPPKIFILVEGNRKEAEI